MSERKNVILLLGLALSVSLIAASLSVAWMASHLGRAQFQTLSAICEGMVEVQPDAEQTVLSVLKEYNGRSDPKGSADFLLRYGYREADFSHPGQAHIPLFIAIGFIAGALLFALTYIFWRNKQEKRIQALAEYLEGINAGNSGALLQNREDEFSKLQDEIYKIVSSLHQTRDNAMEVKHNFAENLYNIAHQLKTPITSISLALQILKERYSQDYMAQIERQLTRLTHLEEALLLLARVDAGTLPISKKDIDVFTVLMLASDNLHEILQTQKVSIDIPELGEAKICADMEWTMEAIMNLLKNCIEHAPAGSTIHCSYAQNPIYTLIRIWDEGQGFSARDIPHLFERFYRGENATPGGIGIGLSLAKEILELQNGTIRAENLPGAGASFEIRIYSHQTVTCV